MNISYQTLLLKKNEILEQLKNVKYNDLKDLIYKMRHLMIKLLIY